MGNVCAPSPCGPIPSPRQLRWHEMEFYGFIHYTVNAFTDREWGYGDESPAVFNPSAMNVRQWVQVAKQAGMKGLILTAKHHDGFCLWPSRYTDHSVRCCPWKDGKGDVVRELSDECEAEGLRFGVYLSPWDRHQCMYGRPEYLAYYRAQLMELLTGYGGLFEIWFDGANGGDGFYGGARESRLIDKRSYYDWQTTWGIVRQLQPEAVMFSDVGPDVRWVGNENGVGTETSWCPVNTAGWCPGDADANQLPLGHEHGPQWIPAETDVSIRPGWFYHAAEDQKVRSAENLVELYYKSVGRNTSLLLNLPPDQRGLIHENDIQSLMGMRGILDRTFARDLAADATIVASTTRGGDAVFGAANVADASPKTYWATDDGVRSGSLEIQWTSAVRFDRVQLQEHIQLGQRVRQWKLEAARDGLWKEIASGTTIGRKRIACLPSTEADRLRLTIVDAKACPCIGRVGVFCS